MTSSVFLYIPILSSLFCAHPVNCVQTTQLIHSNNSSDTLRESFPKLGLENTHPNGEGPTAVA